jgi:hypothetical protein
MFLEELGYKKNPVVEHLSPEIKKYLLDNKVKILPYKLKIAIIEEKREMAIKSAVMQGWCNMVHSRLEVLLGKNIFINNEDPILQEGEHLESLKKNENFKT